MSDYRKPKLVGTGVQKGLLKTPVAVSKNRGVNEALRRAGYKCLPDWWVTEAEFDVIWRMAHNHEEHINEIRAFYRNRNRDDATPSALDGKPD